MKNKIEELYALINKEEDEDLRDMYADAVKSALMACASYVKRVAQMEQRIQLARFRMEGEEYREFVMELDRSRRYHHDSMMGQINMMNRIAARLGKDAIADVDENNRETYADFAMRVVNEYFCKTDVAV